MFVYTFSILLTTTQKTRKQEIFEAAAELFKEKGYAASTMRDIADKVGIEAASLYNHIKSKEELLQAICFQIAEMFTSEMNVISQSTSSNEEKLRAVIYLHVEITTGQAALASVANEEWRHLNEPHLSQFMKMRASYEDKCKMIIEQGVAGKEFRNLNGTTALYTILSSVRWLQYWYREDRGIPVDKIKHEIADLLLKGLNS